MKIKKMRKGSFYTFEEIETFAKNKYLLFEHGEFEVNIHIIKLLSVKLDKVAVFLLNSYNTVRGGMYLCLYSTL